ncbi:hypothetical protein [Dyadobacter psychrotolerans]|uniref:Outer membrane protein beta-barrel domain-containing protein n=1 Tax=Dyadobacter psychrotolerans TaxID=2541721 RepID=A0A4R5DER6_9BACT|nr:hypothetical protein [Dyadobacter psychrotolerans]TDE12392.1 hypothetical protein E0F88_22100 [Dyadobacter psychrotolerans]
MKSSILLLLLVLSCFHVAFGQNYYLGDAGIDVGAGFKSNSWSPSVFYHEEMGLPKLPWLKMGLGFRAWGYYGGKTDLYSQGEKTPGHVLQFRNVSANGLSFVASIKIKVWKLEAGANTDLTGIAFGSNRTAFYPGNTISPGAGEAYYNQFLPSQPVIFNLIPLALDNYNGQSEAFIRIWATKKLGLKLGYVFGQLAYVTRRKDGGKVLLDNRQRRFSDHYQMPYVALCFPLLR